MTAKTMARALRSWYSLVQYGSVWLFSSPFTYTHIGPPVVRPASHTVLFAWSHWLHPSLNASLMAPAMTGDGTSPTACISVMLHVIAYVRRFFGTTVRIAELVGAVMAKSVKTAMMKKTAKRAKFGVMRAMRPHGTLTAMRPTLKREHLYTPWRPSDPPILSTAMPPAREPSSPVKAVAPPRKSDAVILVTPSGPSVIIETAHTEMAPSTNVYVP
mmetsp:Transcript_25869/g.79867  ORF Transcript_25869/g.79867 Transcript_25869/m.79867 type:complete len:215 (+) Transcript_25869:409-1053(+)